MDKHMAAHRCGEECITAWRGFLGPQSHLLRSRCNAARRQQALAKKNHENGLRREALLRLTCKMSMNRCKLNKHMQPQTIRERLKSGRICKAEQNLSLIKKFQNVHGSSGERQKNESLPSKTMLSFVEALRLTVERAREVETERQFFWPP